MQAHLHVFHAQNAWLGEVGAVELHDTPVVAHCLQDDDFLVQRTKRYTIKPGVEELHCHLGGASPHRLVHLRTSGRPARGSAVRIA